MKATNLSSFIVVLMALVFFQAACSGPDTFVLGNEGLRLTPAEIQTCIRQAYHGNADAAKKLWGHYEFVEHKHAVGEYWYTRYERLRKTKGNRRE